MSFGKTNRTVVCSLILAGMLAAARSSRAAEAVAAADARSRFETVAPFVDENTFLVASADLSRMDPGAFEKWIGDLAKGAHGDPDVTKEFAQGMAGARQAVGGWMTAFAKAGGRQAYVLMSLTNLPSPAIVVTLADGADVNAIKELLAPTPPGAEKNSHSYGFPPFEMHAEQIGHALVLAPEATLRRFHDAKPADRPDLSAALAAAGDATLAIALATPADTRRVIEEAMPTLPPELGGGPTTVITRGLRWISLGVHLPPDASIHLTIRAKDAESAKELAGAADTVFKSLGRSMEQEPELSGLSKLVAALKPALSADHPDELSLSLDKAALQDLLISQLPDQLMKARSKAKLVQSMNNIRQLILGCLMYADAHKGEWPDDLDKAAKAGEIPPQVLVNPVKPDSKPGYTYISPGKASEIKDYASRMVIYETEGLPSGRSVGFADGHAEVVKEPQFQKYLKEAQDAAAKRGKQD